jgi:hypothetical protein
MVIYWQMAALNVGLMVMDTCQLWLVYGDITVIIALQGAVNGRMMPLHANSPLVFNQPVKASRIFHQSA